MSASPDPANYDDRGRKAFIPAPLLFAILKFAMTVLTNS
jgi:hypothetical protein